MAIRPELRDELLSLPPVERQELAEALYDSLTDEPADPTWEAAWTEEISRRVRQVIDGEVQLVDAADVHAELRDELQNR